MNNNYNYTNQPVGQTINQPAVQPPPVYYPIKPKKVYSPLNKKDKIVLPLFAIPAFILADYLVNTSLGFGLEFTILCFIQFIISTVYLYDKNKKPSVFTVICGALSLVGSVTLTLYSDYLINYMMLALVCTLYGLYCIGLSGKFRYSTGSYRIIFDFLYDTFVKPFKAIPYFAGAVKASNNKDKKNIYALAGILLAIPAVLIIVPLLMRSDAAFDGFVRGLARNLFSFAFELVVFLIVLPYFITYAYSKHIDFKDKSSVKKAKKVSVNYSAGISFLSVISVVYAVYLFSQLAYFFSAFEGILPEGYTLTASAFARRGFYEMFAICCINIFIVSLTLMLCEKKKDGKVSLALRLLSLFITVFDFVLLVSASAKMVMNVKHYDLSRNRVLVCVFMLMIAVILVFFTIHIFAPRVPYMKNIIIICSVIFIVMSYCDINARVAEYNVREYKNTGVSDNLDVVAIDEMGFSAVPSLIMISNDKDLDKSIIASGYLKAKIDSLLYYGYEIKFDDDMKVYVHNFRDFNFSRYNAALAINDNLKHLKEYDNDKYLYVIGENNLYLFPDEDEEEPYSEDEDLSEFANTYDENWSTYRDDFSEDEYHYDDPMATLAD